MTGILSSRARLLILLLLAGTIDSSAGFVMVPSNHHGHAKPFMQHFRQQQQRRHTSSYPATTTQTTTTTTTLHLLLDVPDGFFTVTFPMLGILLSISKNFARIRMEENAWEQRLAEARLQRLQQDPTLTELDLRRQEAAMEWSAYGKPAAQQLERELAAEQEQDDRRRTKRVRVMDRDDDDDLDEEEDIDPRQYRMTADEIAAFELEFGVQYDPYYDDPYTEDELPEGTYSVDRLYGDRVYDNGEIFYKDKHTGLFYRQGCKPRNLSFWK